ncbi:NPCBM/NEW2 domain-containing protein [Bacillus sp. MUM 13]|uniref:NPCBM/NEW2 domain-containing protein n=1 Tax=Bacillus sp. MUM 13 TaxID=1678001 RepID=UPI0008F5D7EB|nr:NPCBM/NEW2 domain-containing protein [Bacillus sp. MUM 13]OIK07157.1 hypothetical protein BIV59_21235 [Bacillus sp. MUM 13]
MVMAGSTYNKGYHNGAFKTGSMSFNLGGKFHNISGLIGFEDHADQYNARFIFKADGHDISSYDNSSSGLPIKVDINVSNVWNLEVIVQAERDSWFYYDFINVIVK